MAGTSIKGITIEIGGDTTGLTTALKGVNGQLKTTESDLKKVEKLLKLDPKNTELLAQKQRLLSQAVSETKDKLSTLKTAAEQANEQLQKGEISQAQYDALQREIIECEDSLKRLEKAAAQSNVAMQKIAATAKSVADGADKVASATKKISAAAAGAVAGLAALGYKAVTNADDLNTLAKQTGFTTAELQKLQYASDRIDVSMDDVTGAAKKLKSAMASGKSTFKELGIEIIDTNGNMRNATDVFWDCVQALSKVENETRRDQLAMDLFGKSADSLAGIIDDGGAALRAYGDEAERAGLIMSQETLDSLNQVNDAIDKVKATAQGALAQAGAKAIEAALPVIEKVIAAIQSVLEWLGSLDQQQIAVLMTILAIVAAISPLASLIANVATAANAIIPVVAAVVGALGGWAALIPVIVGLVAFLAYQFLFHMDEIKAGAKMTIDEIKEWFESLGFVGEVVANMLRFTFFGMWDAILTLGKGIVNAVMSMIEGMVNSVIASINGIISAINAVASALAGLFGFGYSGIGKVGYAKLPRMANGGILRHGTSLVGEYGPELLTVDNGQAVVQPLSGAAASGSADTSIGATGNSTTNVNISFTGSLAQLAAILQPAIQVETARRGPSFVKA